MSLTYVVEVGALCCYISVYDLVLRCLKWNILFLNLWCSYFAKVSLCQHLMQQHI